MNDLLIMNITSKAEFAMVGTVKTIMFLLSESIIAFESLTKAEGVPGWTLPH